MSNYYPPQPYVAQPSNGMGVTSLVLGIIGLLFSFVPVIGVIAWPLVILGIIFSAVGLNKAAKGRATNKGLAITGLVVSIIGLIICIVWAVAFKEAADDLNEEANREVTIVYEVSGDAANVDVTYVTYSDAKATDAQETVATLPWSKEVKTKGLVKEGQLIATTGAEGGSVTCKITVDGKEVSTKTATGQFAMADCLTI